MSDIFKTQGRFDAEILAKYNEGKISAELSPYFRWKEGGVLPTHQEVLTMQAQCSSEIEVIWESEKVDDLLASYYRYVENELLKIDMMYRNGVIN